MKPGPQLHNFISPDVNHGHARFDPAPDVRAHLPMSLGRLPEVAPHLLIGSVQGTLLLTGGSPRCSSSDGDETSVTGITPSRNPSINDSFLLLCFVSLFYCSSLWSR